MRTWHVSFLCTIYALEKEQARGSVIRDSLSASGGLNVTDLTLHGLMNQRSGGRSERTKLIKRHLPLDVASAE
jgi:hypothetical protein